jgi:hypothetical protein
MLVPQQAQSQSQARQGCRPASVGELRRQLASPSSMDDGNRQRLLELKRRLARVQALGDEFARVSLSPMAEAAMDRCPLSR